MQSKHFPLIDEMSVIPGDLISQPDNSDFRGGSLIISVQPDLPTFGLISKSVYTLPVGDCQPRTRMWSDQKVYLISRIEVP